jgi:acyl carrier protein
MNIDEARGVVLTVLGRIAPEIDPATVDGDADIGGDLDLDSMDFLNLVEGVATETGVEIPERDYPQVATLSSFAQYLVGAGLASGSSTAP